MRFSSLQKAVRERMKEYGGCRATARALGISPAHISRLSNGVKKTASPSMLKKLEIKEIRLYEV